MIARFLMQNWSVVIDELGKGFENRAEGTGGTASCQRHEIFC